jgi:hypothetical protein
MEKADKYLGGQSGKAVDAIKSRTQKLDEAIDGPKKESTKESPNRNGSGDGGRPAQSKKWYERILGN